MKNPNFIFVLIFTFLYLNIPFYAVTFRSLVYNGYTINFIPAYSINFNASVPSGEIQPNSIVCSDVFTINSTYNSNFSISSANLECPTGNCKFYPSNSFILSSQPLQTLWLNSPNYQSNISYYCSPAVGGDLNCYRYYSTITEAGINPLAPYIFSASYYQSLNLISNDAAANGSLFCNANIKFIDNGNVIRDTDLTSYSNFTYTPSVGDHSLTGYLVVNNCSFLARTYEQPQQKWYGTISPVRDALYFNRDNPSLTYSVTIPSSSLSFKVTNGPSLVVTNKQTDYPVDPGGEITFYFTVKNTGDIDARITNVSITDGFTAQSFIPLTIKAGESVEFSVSAIAPNQEEEFSPNMTLNFTSKEPVIGTCGSASITNFNVGTVKVKKRDVEPIKVHLFASPSGFFNERNMFIPSKLNITAHITRDPSNDALDEVYSNITIYYYNISRNGWQIKFNATNIPGREDEGEPNGRKYVVSVTNDGDVYINLNETISSDHNYGPGVYKVEIKSYDQATTTDEKLKIASKYFVIFSLTGCEKKV